MKSNQVLVRALASSAEGVIQHYGTKKEHQFDFMPELRDFTRSLDFSDSELCNHNAEAIGQLFRDARRLEYMKKMLEGLTTAFSIVQPLFRNRLDPIASKLSKGLASLPDELLSLIFELATSKNEDRRHAIWLSHVSRRFRTLVLELKSLWTILDSKASKDELDAVISRSGHDADLHVVIHTSNSFVTEEILSFLGACQETSSRWATLRVSSDVEEVLGSLDFTLRHIYERLQRLDLPRLREFRIKRIRPFVDRSVRRTSSPSWIAPNLQVLRCDEYIPMVCPSFQSITSTIISTFMADNEYPNLLASLIAFLASASNLSHLNLTIRTSGDLKDLPTVLTRSCRCPSLTSLLLNFPSLPVPRLQSSFPHQLTWALSMPNLTELSVFATLYAGEFADMEARQRCGIGEIINSLLPNHAVHSKLTMLSVEIKHPPTSPGGESSTTTQDWSKWLVGVPLHRIPHVSTLDLKTFSSPIFRCAEGENVSCSLRKVRFRGWEQLNMWKLHEVIESLKLEADWDALEAIEVEDIESFSAKASVSSYIEGAEKIRFISGDAC